MVDRLDNMTIKPVLRWWGFAGLLSALLSVVFLLSFPASAQDTQVTVQTIEQQIAALEADDEIEATDKDLALELLVEARTEIVAATQRKAQADGYANAALNSREIIAELDQDISDLQSEDTEIDIPNTVDALRGRLTSVQSDRAVQEDRRARLLEERTMLAGRASAIADEIAATRGQLDDLEELAAGDETADDSPLGQARRTLRAARTYANRTDLNTLNRELQSIPERQSIVSTRIRLRETIISGLDQEISQLAARLSDVRDDLAEAALLRAGEELASAQQLGAPDLVLAEENLDLARELKTMASESLVIDTLIEDALETKLLIGEQAETVERIIATGRVTTEAGTLLRRLRSSLPSVLSLRNQIDDAVESRAETQLNLALWQERLNAIDNEPFDGQSVEDFSTSDETEVSIFNLQRSLKDHQRALLQSLIDAGQNLSDRLTQKEIAVSETLTSAQDLRNSLDRRLLWLPSNVRPFSNFQSNLQRALVWMAQPEGLQNAWEQYQAAFGDRALLFIIVMLLSVLAYASRQRLAAMTAELNEDVGKVARDRYTTTPFALLLCLVRSASIPGILLAIALPAYFLESENAHLTALTGGLVSAALFIWLILFLRTIAEEDGLLAKHFHWNRRSINALHDMRLWAVALFGAAFFLFVSTVASQRSDVEYSLGMVVLLALSIQFAIVGYRVFELDRGLVRNVIESDQRGGYLFMGILTFCVAPVITGLIPLLGYFDTAVALQSRLLGTAALLTVLVLAYGVLRRIILIAQKRYILRKASEERSKRIAQRERLEAEGEEEDKTAAQFDPVAFNEELEEQRKRITNQTLTLLVYFEITGALIGILAIWGNILPALGVANDIVLWTGVDTINGDRLTRPVTLWNLILFFAFIAAGIVAASNIRGFLEIGPLQRLRLSAGSRFAIYTIVGYVLIGVGIVAGFLQLGVDWSRLQWIIAALGVGLGFGLQEIVANFISGLIILFERPVRVGDTVTIGDLDGDVTNIAIRATTVKDFDNREVLLPNKSIITENVTNWTLSDTIMRIIIDIGVAYGSDIARVREVILKVAADEPDVLETPEPRLFFMNHGDSSLDFELRVYISNPRKRFRVRDRLNTEMNIALAEAGIEIPFPQRDIHFRGPMPTE